MSLSFGQPRLFCIVECGTRDICVVVVVVVVVAAGVYVGKCVDVQVCDSHRENSNPNSKTLILRDSSLRSIWTCLTACPCYTTNTNKHNNTTNKYY